MKKNVIICGLISGVIITAIMLSSMLMYSNNVDFEGGMLLGYASMLLGFSLIFVAIKNTRDKYDNGVISFGKAFKIGFYISLIASTMYVFAWMIEYNFFLPDFMDKYSEHMIKKAQESGLSGAKLEEQVAEMARYKELYKNPIFFILITYSEILPVGLLITLICSLILKRKENPDTTLPA